MAEARSFITFVIGAGASNEVKMPTGYELKKRIAESFAFEYDDLDRISAGDGQLREALFQLGQRQGARGSRSDYFRAAQLIRAAMPQAPSIDNFIDSHRSNPLVAECGKLAIAREILRAERSSTIFVDPGNSYNTLDFVSSEGTWFNAFFQLLTLNAQFNDLSERLKRVRVVSFNYDRTLEHFLHHSIQNYYARKPDEVTEVLASLQVLHPYGCVGVLPWQQPGLAVPFGGDMHSSALLQVSTGLRTFTEGTSESDSEINAIRSAVFDAETLVFLGFAYHELNLELLFGSARNVAVRHTKQVFGTAKGLSESNKKAIAQELATLGRYDPSQITLRRELSAAELLPEYSRSLRIPSAA